MSAAGPAPYASRSSSSSADARAAVPTNPDPQAVMKAWHRTLTVDGFLMFSTLGPGSLGALSQIYAQADWSAP